MISRLATHLLLRPEDIKPSHPGWSIIGVFNPGVIRCGDRTIILARVAEKPMEERRGWTAHPRWSRDEGYTVDWVENEQLRSQDPRVMHHVGTGLVRLTFISHLRVFTSRDGRHVDDFNGTLILPEHEMEEFGLEDPRITRIGERYYFTYVAVSRHGPATALASTLDFETFDRHGIIFCPENKDVVLLPERIDGEYIALHRPLGDMPFCAPEMWIARSPDLIHWGQHDYLFAGAGEWENGRVGAGAPPFEVEDGWLEIYHGNRAPEHVGEVGAYCAGAMLLAKDDPGRVLKVSRDALLTPQEPFENEGFVSKVVFPTGVVQEDDRLLIYYGASDKYCAMIEVARDEVLGALHNHI
ncbi:MAG TPA: glycoside hydrolase family 130 protein [Lacipirellulaceae bacterium]|jgi:predicted GH43/DUF377 family glycosyl hydrolase|nr:glycoside hydrolase family 130 protein [Lacipirellulaceae bacterium]